MSNSPSADLFLLPFEVLDAVDVAPADLADPNPDWGHDDFFLARRSSASRSHEFARARLLGHGGLRIVDSDSDTDTEEQIVAIGETPLFQDADLPFCWECLRVEDDRTYPIEEFGWEDLASRVDERDIFRVVAFDEEENANPTGEDDVEDDRARNVEWEVLLSLNSLGRNDADSVFFEDQEGFVNAAEYDVLFGQFGDHANEWMKSGRPAARSVVESLPSVFLTVEDNNTHCAVCKDEISLAEKVKRLPCLHHYHEYCIVPWLAIRNTCPLCRFELPSGDVSGDEVIIGDEEEARASHLLVVRQWKMNTIGIGFSSPTSRLIPFRRGGPQVSQLLLRRPWHPPRRILDPGGDVVLKWNRVFLVSCLVSLFLDPLYFYLMYIGGPGCMRIDLGLGIIVTFFRTVADLFYLAHMMLKFRTAFVAPNSRVFGRGDLVKDPHQIALRYLKGDFVIDLAAMLPIPQILIWFVIPAVSSSSANHTNNTLSMIVFIQYIPRLFLIFPLNARIVKATGVLARTAWAGAAYNLLLYMLASHVLGALWYLLSMERQYTCWVTECAKENGTLNLPVCNPSFLDCRRQELPERKAWLNATNVLRNCDATKEDVSFNFGMFADVLTDEVVGATFLAKYLYCLWWGLRNLSSYGQNLATSTFVGETSFAILISITGLVLFSHLIGNMQSYLQSITVRLEEWRVRRRDIEEWMTHRQLPLDLQDRVRRFVQYKWLATRGVDEESILRDLPLDLRREIRRHLCLALVRRVPFFSQMDDQLLDAICERLVSSLSAKDNYIVREGDPVNEMLFIIRGQLESSTTDGGRSGFFNSITLRPGDFCGEELLTWALMPNPNINLPLSTRTVRALDEVEAFALRAEDLKFVANQFKRLHSKKLQHAFRFYSHQWRTWGACFIQVAWRKYKKRKLVQELSMLESDYYMPVLSDASQLIEDIDAPLLVDFVDNGWENALVENASNHNQLGATFLASKFAKNTKRGANQKLKRDDPSLISIKMPKLLKPDEPDFSFQSEDDGT
ncbi:hypothetical protein HPP92_019374 [Vanilla planifolia]|uniref:Uncharacterized protein n=1 Tax=Vanilla planifolia TaxID=51239 RepID=A0A835Q327_VANPL|nr:hypothetical protein HPP92_019374 [Vanilla planifolia]